MTPRLEDAVLRNLQVLAESTQRLSSELKLAHPEVVYEDGLFKSLREVDLHEGTMAFVVLKPERITNVARRFRTKVDRECDVRVRRREAMNVVDA
jgi:predicted DNA-binding antitoxin AbrB/MazE fold protein